MTDFAAEAMRAARLLADPRVTAEEREVILTTLAGIERDVERDFYKDRPVLYIRDKLGITLTPEQEDIARVIIEPPYKTLVRSAHSVGKTFLAAALTNWFYETRDPGVVLTTAPSKRDVEDLLWTEIALQRSAAGLPKPHLLTEMKSAPDHFAKGFTAERGEMFVGRHRKDMGFIFDEGNNIEPQYYTATSTMFKPSGGHFWLVIFNPLDTACQAYTEEMSGSWRVMSLSAVNHPNVTANLSGAASTIPAAVDLAQVRQWLKDWCDRIDRRDAGEEDIEWPPGSREWYRPGPEFQSRALGRWPSLGVQGVWSEGLFRLALRAQASPCTMRPELGIDPAAQGDDFTAIHVRWGPRSVHHERHNGWLNDRTAMRAKELCEHWAHEWNRRRPPGMTGGQPLRPQDIAIKYDSDGGYGANMMTFAQGFRFVPVSASGKAVERGRYPNRRSELWFSTAQLARDGAVSIAALPRETISLLRRQLLAPRWSPDGAGRRVVEEKRVTKKRLKYSPDDADAFNLAFSMTPDHAPRIVDLPPRDRPSGALRGAPEPTVRRRYFGRS